MANNDTPEVNPDDTPRKRVIYRPYRRNPKTGKIEYPKRARVFRIELPD